MPSRRTIPYNYGTFFITFTCHKWLPLIKQVIGYDIIYKWFDELSSKGHFINGYVIMPNHVHLLISFIDINQKINTIVGNGKRFMAYEIIKRLKENDEREILEMLATDVNIKRKANNKIHEVWELSFDWKECNSKKFIDQKLDYIHKNPCKGKWNLCTSPTEYEHSSAKFYLNGEQGVYNITNIGVMHDVVFVKKDGGINKVASLSGNIVRN